MTREDPEKDRIQFKLDLMEITRGNPKHKLEDQTTTIKRLKIFMKQKKKLLNCIMNMLELMFEAKYKTKYGEGIEHINS